MAKYAIVRTDGMSGTKDPTLTVSLKYYTTVDQVETPTEIQNASIVVLGDKLTLDATTTPVTVSREVYKATTPTSSSKIEDIVLVANPELFYDESRHHDLSEYINEAGEVIRGYVLHKRDNFSATAEAFQGTPAIGSYVIVGNTTKLVISATATGNTVIGKIDQIETIGKDTYYHVQCAF